MIKLALFASGNGSNAERIINYFKDSDKISVECIVSNKKDAFVHERAKKLNVPSVYFSRNDFYETDNVLNYLKENTIDYIILAGFLWLIPQNLLASYPNKIINIHPALLPKYGGKNMYGMNVHKAVVENKEKESGITIHYVNEKYDDGKTIFQAKCVVVPSDTSESLAQKIHELEYEFFPSVIEQVINNNQ